MSYYKQGLRVGEDQIAAAPIKTGNSPGTVLAVIVGGIALTYGVAAVRSRK